ncbi:unnamed protein product [Rhizophagus irregularis]|nr:unnamed protein product [Rhizophagus irregularis]
MQNFTDNTDNENSSYYINWLEKSISDNYIKCYTSKIIDRIGNGSFGSVYRTNWKGTNNVLALKSFNNSSILIIQASTLLRKLLMNYLYTKCWKDDTSFIDTNEENVTTMEISKEFSDMNQDLLIDNIPNMIGPKSTSSCLQTYKLFLSI